MSEITLTLSTDYRIDYARSVVAVLRATMGHQEDVVIEGESAFGLFNLLSLVEDLLTSEIKERDAKLKTIPQENPAHE